MNKTTTWSFSLIQWGQRGKRSCLFQNANTERREEQLSAIFLTLQRETSLLTRQRNSFLCNWPLFERKSGKILNTLFFYVVSSVLFCPVYYPVWLIICMPFRAYRLYIWCAVAGSFQQVILKRRGHKIHPTESKELMFKKKKKNQTTLNNRLFLIWEGGILIFYRSGCHCWIQPKKQSSVSFYTTINLPCLWIPQTGMKILSNCVFTAEKSARSNI